MAKVSLILPIYNVSQYLRECLDSVVGQTLRDIEILCVNDGSTDDSLDIINEYAAKDPRIVVITGPNGGYGKAMNKGLDQATGDYIGIVEPDDYVVPEIFEELYRTAAQHDLDLVKADFYRFTRDENGQEHLQYVALDSTGTRYGQLLCPAEDPSCIRFTLNTWAGIYRRAFLNEYGIRHHETPGASFQDNGFFFQTFAYARRAMIVNRPYYRNRRDNPNSSVASKAKVYCMNVEYDFIRDLLMRDRQVWERFQYLYWWQKFRNYTFTYDRIADSYKPEYMARMRQEFKRAMQLGQLRQSDFEPTEWLKIQSMISGANGILGRMRSLTIVKKLAPYIPQPAKQLVVKAVNLAMKAKKTIVGVLR